MVGEKVFCKTIPKAKIEDIMPAMESTFDWYHTKALILRMGSNNIFNPCGKYDMWDGEDV